MPGRTIFRETALEAYRQRTTRDVLPRLTRWPIITAMWLLLAVLLAAAATAWSVHVPTYVSAAGVIAATGDGSPAAGGVTATLFVPPDETARLRVGDPVHGQIGSSGKYVEGSVTAIEPGVITPVEARDRYRIDGASDVITEPSRAVTLRLDDAARVTGSGGSRLDARIEVGSQPLLALFPGLGDVLGGDG